MCLSLVLVQPRKTRTCLTEKLLMGRKESNQTNKQQTMTAIVVLVSIQETIGIDKMSTPRGNNFDTKENELILELCAENNELLTCKHNSVVTLQKKNSVLSEICEKVNALGVAHRMLQQLKTKRSNVVSDCKAKDAEIRRSHGKTAGAPCTPATATQDKIMSIFGDIFLFRTKRDP